ncbi:Queuosine precursor ECF transporter S component QueT [uncultured Clostridium sp.]|uniref:QueT transporter family protein n=1 Tax=uncultured Clostridium sp. TaxID=59620 RepID=UPI000821C3D1|nr:QueT transporter family protein [uncultured Clostridium sp.]SCJ99195.1 Queuosine precursor ECF transporter S component QueT [uncultured Clostridium sp.]
MNQNLTKRIVVTGVIAAIYTVLTLILAPISFGPVQFRLSEIMVLLAFVDPLYIIGLTLGCLISNMLGGFGIMDIVFGSLATFMSCVAMYWTRNVIKNAKTSLLVASIWPTVFNGAIIGWMLHVTINVPMFITMIQVALGEFVVVTLIGVPLGRLVAKKYGKFFKRMGLV